MMLELLAAQRGVFVTLTYDDDHLPVDGSLDKRHVQLFMKLLRYYTKVPVRFYAVGEYGEQKGRPHYHLILFGVDYAAKDAILKAWTRGGVHVGSAEPDSMQYVAGYVTKKMTNPKDKRLQGRYPEFALMSRRPGIGSNAVQAFAESIWTQKGAAASLQAGWVPDTFRVGKAKYPMDRFIKEKLYHQLNVSKKQRQAKMRELVAKNWVLKMSMPTKTLEEQRRARVQQQSGRIGLERKKRL